MNNMVKNELRDYEESWSVDGLHSEEVDVLMAVLEKVLEKIGTPDKGTFILSAQRDDAMEPQNVVSFDFRRGPVRHFLGQYHNSRHMAQNVIRRDAKPVYRDVGSHISYFPSSPLYLRLNATRGHFACTYFAGNGDYIDQTLVYCAVAKVLARLGSDDEKIREGCDTIFDTEVEDSPGLSNLEDYIDDLFEEDKLPEIQKWRDWCNFNEKIECPRVFFA